MIQLYSDTRVNPQKEKKGLPTPPILSQLTIPSCLLTVSLQAAPRCQMVTDNTNVGAPAALKISPMFGVKTEQSPAKIKRRPIWTNLVGISKYLKSLESQKMIQQLF